MLAYLSDLKQSGVIGLSVFLLGAEFSGRANMDSINHRLSDRKRFRAERSGLCAIDEAKAMEIKQLAEG